jgi:Ca2+-binding RTX toxin-like protein
VPSGGTGQLSVSAGAIAFNDGSPQDCGGATLANTESIKVNGTAGTVEQLTIDQRGGAFEGGTAEIGDDEVEMVVELGDATDLITVRGTNGNDSITVGYRGVATNLDTDLDVEILPVPARISVYGEGGVNTLSARGAYGGGGVYNGVFEAFAGDLGDTLVGGYGNDVLTGGAGADTLEGREANDVLSGGGGNDSLLGNEGNDSLTGGAGSDTFGGSGGDDLLRADDDEADGLINGGPGADTVHYDSGLDTSIVAVETKIAA